jgi:hypothetical protein
MMKRSLICLAAALAIGVLSPRGAQAQLWPSNMREPGLTKDDIELGKQATRPIFDSDDVTPGQSLAWSNPATGNSGYATFEKATKFRGLPCRTVRYDVALVKPVRQRTYTVNWCRTPNSGWKVAN